MRQRRNWIKTVVVGSAVVAVCLLCQASSRTASHATARSKPSPDEAIGMLKAGNARFVAGESEHPRTTVERLIQAGKESQGDHAYATVITCSDSRVPVERIFDAGVMDIFVIRVAGNVCDVDEVGSIEYGLAHVHTPVLVVLGHTQCGAVTAVTHALHGKGDALERNIPPLIDNINPAVERAMHKHPHVHGDAIIPLAIEENVWKGIEDLFLTSPATRQLVRAGKAKVVGAIYDVSTGKVHWLPVETPEAILVAVEADPDKATNVYAEDPGHGTTSASDATAKHESGAGHGEDRAEHTSSSVAQKTAKAKPVSVFAGRASRDAGRSGTTSPTPVGPGASGDGHGSSHGHGH